MNIITIVCDTFRRDHLGCYGNDWIHTENLDHFASQSMVFDRAYCGSFPTGHMRHDLFTGTYTFAHTFGDYKLDDNELAIQDVLRSDGYMTMLSYTWLVAQYQQLEWKVIDLPSVNNQIYPA